MAVPICNLTTWEDEIGGLPGVQGQPGLSGQGNMGENNKPCQKQTKKKKRGDKDTGKNEILF